MRRLGRGLIAAGRVAERLEARKAPGLGFVELTGNVS